MVGRGVSSRVKSGLVSGSSTELARWLSLDGSTLFLGRPLRFLGGMSVSTSAALESPPPTILVGELNCAGLLIGVPLRFGFGVDPVSDFLGRPRGRLTGEDASGSFNGTVVVLVLVTLFTDGDSAFSPSSGSAWTVTLMRQGLAPLPRGVLMIMDLDGDEKTISDVSGLRACLRGELASIGFRGLGLRCDEVMFSSKEMARGSGLDSLLRPE